VQPVFRAQMALARAEVLQGRIYCRLDRLTRWGNTVSRSAGGSESLQFKTGEEGKGTSMHYELRAAERWITIDASQNAITMERLSRRDGKVVATTRFEQPETGPLVFFVDNGGEQVRLQGDSIWQFWLSDSKTCTENLLPLCEMIGMDLPWRQFTESLEVKLLRLADAGQKRASPEWREWVDQLGDERFAVREAADRRLRGVGASLVPFARQLDATRLDAEQRFRLRRILHSMEGELTADTVDSVAEWLLDDPRAWLELLDRRDVADRTIAVRQLNRLLSSDVDFTPAADDALRDEQLARLRLRVDGLFHRH